MFDIVICWIFLVGILQEGAGTTDNHYEMFDCNSLRSIGMAAVQDVEINKNDIKLLEFKRSSVYMIC